MEIHADEKPIAVFGKTERGPGWVNYPVYIVLQGKDGLCRVECLQPNEQTREMKIMHPVSEVVNKKMIHMLQDIVIDKMVNTEVEK